MLRQPAAEFKSISFTEAVLDHVLPNPDRVEHGRQALYDTLLEDGLGLQRAVEHLQQDILPALNNSSRSPNYYGFVTGGATPGGEYADHLVTTYDQNLGVHLPNDGIATDVENKALILLCDLLNLDWNVWSHRTFTTGATASNVLGLACGRDFVVKKAGEKSSSSFEGVGERGLIGAMITAGLEHVQVLTSVPHSSLSKAASVVGIGRTSVKSSCLDSTPHRIDMDRLEEQLQSPRTASIIAISCSEVNTGLFATTGIEEMRTIRNLADKYGAWIHVDGAFGIMGRILSSPEYDDIIRGCAGMELADSITGDGHKLLNVPYDCGFFLSKHLDIAQAVFQNPNAAYLSTAPSSIPSPLDIGLENSRRFRALPVYASLLSYGRSGYVDMLKRQIQLARDVAVYISRSESFELLALPDPGASESEIVAGIFIIVLFRAKDPFLNVKLVSRINSSRKIYVSGTSWEGKPACRFAVSNWKTDVTRDLPIIVQVLEGVVEESKL
ncbi:PLP-dependent transferase [Patellaria atrata CBS 101060]|uniref:PLP-dependent transferase n=1 Tax=Patellaria atrata CBS 101060 TaxID=1346257 RepID=A0A9P4S5X1_9PEZI|nr:PLP-dependent transferase [Patellaria atrata CBS 101060]